MTELETCPTCRRPLHMRPVSMFINLDDCEADQQARGDCLRVDMHGFWWSVPLELSVTTMVDQIEAIRAAHKLLTLQEHVNSSGVIR